MALGGQEHLNVLRGGIENRREVGRGHLDDLTTMVSNAWRWLLGVWRIFGIEMFEAPNSRVGKSYGGTGSAGTLISGSLKYKA
jgi:hypothetical protein